jgi:alpha-amylase
VAEISFPRTVSWADAERDLSAWQGNSMQTRALKHVYGLGERIKRLNHSGMLALWRKLTTSDHYYYMCTKSFGDGDVHAYFSPYESPYEAFINFMNAVSDLEHSLLQLEARNLEADVEAGGSAREQNKLVGTAEKASKKARPLAVV